MAAVEMKFTDAEALVDRLHARGTSVLNKDAPHLASDLVAASRLIRALLRGTHKSDVFILPHEGGSHE